MKNALLLLAGGIAGAACAASFGGWNVRMGLLQLLIALLALLAAAALERRSK
jgi:hypothetical protein